MTENRFGVRRDDSLRQRWRENQKNGRRWVGFFLLIVGGLFLARESGVDFPVWFFTWPMILIGFGLLSGMRHGFRGFGWLLPILIGSLFLVDKLSPEFRIRPYIWPVVLIALGLVFLLRPKRDHWATEDDTFNWEPADAQEPGAKKKTGCFKAMNDGSEVMDATAIFGGVKKNIVSKNFRGGDVTTFMGGAEINLTQADGSGRMVIDCFSMFGGTKLIVPPDWNIQTDIVTIFGGIEDKRPPSSHSDPDKLLVLDGTCIFGGVEIKSF